MDTQNSNSNINTQDLSKRFSEAKQEDLKELEPKQGYMIVNGQTIPVTNPQQGIPQPSTPVDAITPTVTTAPTVQIVEEELPPSPSELLNALYYAWDAFDRANVVFFLVNQTAKDVKDQFDLTGNGVEIGIRRMEWVSGGRRMLDAFLGLPTEESESQAIYLYNNVPITLNIYEDSSCITSPDTILYRNEVFRLPNTLELFEKTYG